MKFFGGGSHLTAQGIQSGRSISRIVGSMRERRFKLNSQTMLRVFVILLFFVVTFFVVKTALKGGNKSATKSAQTLSASSAKSSQQINRTFTFPIRNSKGETISELSYSIESAELRDEILVKGQKVRPIKGKVFLILALKIANRQNKGIEIRTRDYIRLSTDKSSELLAPDIHNDPVEVQAISTKYTRVGFIANENVRDFILQVGEVEGVKEKIALKLKN